MSESSPGIQAVIFALDGTLVQTEKLKAISYARAAVVLYPRTLHEAEVIDAFKEVEGLSRREVATVLVERFDLAEKAAARMSERGCQLSAGECSYFKILIY